MEAASPAGVEAGRVPALIEKARRDAVGMAEEFARAKGIAPRLTALRAVADVCARRIGGGPLSQ